MYRARTQLRHQFARPRSHTCSYTAHPPTTHLHPPPNHHQTTHSLPVRARVLMRHSVGSIPSGSPDSEGSERTLGGTPHCSGRGSIRRQCHPLLPQGQTKRWLEWSVARRARQRPRHIATLSCAAERDDSTLTILTIKLTTHATHNAMSSRKDCNG